MSVSCILRARTSFIFNLDVVGEEYVNGILLFNQKKSKCKIGITVN